MDVSVAPNASAGAWLGLDNAAVLIAGAGGIGRGLIEGFADVGARVVTVDGDAGRVRAAVEELELERRGGHGLVTICAIPTAHGRSSPKPMSGSAGSTCSSTPSA